eukprot:scaffold1236_cov503-Prasinococcus_capsulatus_cf.AAC.3
MWTGHLQSTLLAASPVRMASRRIRNVLRPLLPRRVLRAPQTNSGYALACLISNTQLPLRATGPKPARNLSRDAGNAVPCMTPVGCCDMHGSH